MAIRENLEAMLARGEDNALLRFTLGDLCLKADEPATAAEHLAEAVRQKPDYSAAWKLYGRALVAAGKAQEAEAVFEEGLSVAEARGDMQAVREMQVFLRRLRKS